MKRVIVIGAGLSGLLAATALARAGIDVTCVHFGTGGLVLQPGLVDVFGYDPGLVASPMKAVSSASAGHPYAAIGARATTRGLELLRELAGPGLLIGDAQTNVALPTAVGAWRPACLYPPSMAAGIKAPGKMVIVGLRGLRDFNPALIAGNLAKGNPEAVVRHATMAVAPGPGGIAALAFARYFDTAAGQRALASALRFVVHAGETVGLPAVLGLDNPNTWRLIQESLGHAVFEIPLPPPSVPGWRLNNALTDAATQAGVRFWHGARVVAVSQEGGRATGVVIESAGHPSELKADAIVLATGGLTGGGLDIDDHQTISEPICNLPLANVPGEPFNDDPLTPQPMWLVGVPVDAGMHPLDAGGQVVLPNLHAIGGLLAGSARSAEKTTQGISAGSAMAAVDAIMEELK